MYKEECKKYVGEAWENNAKIKLVREAMEKLGCRLPPGFVAVEECQKDVGGGFAVQQGILVCANHLHSRGEVATLLLHELLHAYDQCRVAHVDWSNCRHHACSEVRAANLSGDCTWWEEVKRGQLNIRAQHRKCVMRRAMLSVALNPFCEGAAAKHAVEDVFDTCLRDRAPFGQEE